MIDQYEAVTFKIIDDTPTAKAKWIEEREQHGKLETIMIKCSLCNHYPTAFPHEKPNYCPNCGAKMDKE